MARLKQTTRIVASSSGAQPSASAPASPPPDAAPSQDYARVYDWAPLALLAETSTQLPKNHLKTLLSNDPDEPSCAIDRENDFNVRIRIPPRGMPIYVDDRATNGGALHLHILRHLQKVEAALAFHLLREGADDGAERSPLPTPPECLGFHTGIRDPLQLLWA